MIDDINFWVAVIVSYLTLIEFIFRFVKKVKNARNSKNSKPKKKRRKSK